MKQKTGGVEQLYPLIGGDPRYDYRYGMFTTEESPDCHFRISFNDHSFLFRLGESPELKIYADGNSFSFPGRQDYDESKLSWFFPIDDKKMNVIAHADCIKILTIQSPIDYLNLNRYETNVWKAFFLAGIAECIEEECDSRLLEEFHIQRYLAAAKYRMRADIEQCIVARTKLADAALNPQNINVFI